MWLGSSRELRGNGDGRRVDSWAVGLAPVGSHSPSSLTTPIQHPHYGRDNLSKAFISSLTHLKAFSAPCCIVFRIKAKFLRWHTRISRNPASYTLFQLRPSRPHLPHTQSALPRPTPCSAFPFLSIVYSYPLVKPTPSGLAPAMSVVLHTHAGSSPGPGGYLQPRTFCQELSRSISSLGCELLEARACVCWIVRAHLSSRQPMDSTHVFSWMNELQCWWGGRLWQTIVSPNNEEESIIVIFNTCSLTT